MANAANKNALQSVGGGDVFAPPADLKVLFIAEEDPKHPNHAEHERRVDPQDPENVALLLSLREHGWPQSMNISVAKDGERFRVTDGRRRLTFTRIENARRKAEKDPRGPIRPRIVLDKDPLLTEALANALHKSDPPMVLARRFSQMRASGMSAIASAAAVGLSLKEAQALEELLRAGHPQLSAAVNDRLIPFDVALRAAKDGSAAVERLLAKVRDGNGKVDKAKVCEAKKTSERRPKARPAAVLSSAAERIAPTDERLAAVLLWAAGGQAPDWLAALLPEPARSK